jgi:hypothetical protein
LGSERLVFTLPTSLICYRARFCRRLFTVKGTCASLNTNSRC